MVAIDATTGEQLWQFDPGVWKQEAFLYGFHRGVSYWRGEDGEHLFGTFEADSTWMPGPVCPTRPSAKALRRPDAGVGRRSILPLCVPDAAHHSHDVAVGSTIIDWWADVPCPSCRPGDVRGIDVRTGEVLWTFHTVPHDGEFGAETWEEAGEARGAANVWSQMSADHELGYVYLPTGTISSDYYGGGRPGDNLFGDALVASTCAPAHMALPAHPSRTLRLRHARRPGPGRRPVDGRPVKAVAQISKQGYYVFDRVTGEPVWSSSARRPHRPHRASTPRRPSPIRPGRPPSITRACRWTT